MPTQERTPTLAETLLYLGVVANEFCRSRLNAGFVEDGDFFSFVLSYGQTGAKLVNVDRATMEYAPHSVIVGMDDEASGARYWRDGWAPTPTPAYFHTTSATGS